LGGLDSLTQENTQSYPKNETEIEMNARTEGTIAIVTALVVLFSAMWDPRISVVVSVVALVALGVYRFVQKGK
jgi:hypothetical protein